MASSLATTKRRGPGSGRRLIGGQAEDRCSDGGVRHGAARRVGIVGGLEVVGLTNSLRCLSGFQCGSDAVGGGAVGRGQGGKAAALWLGQAVLTQAIAFGHALLIDGSRGVGGVVEQDDGGAAEFRIADLRRVLSHEGRQLGISRRPGGSGHRWVTVNQRASRVASD